MLPKISLGLAGAPEDPLLAAAVSAEEDLRYRPAPEKTPKRVVEAQAL